MSLCYHAPVRYKHKRIYEWSADLTYVVGLLTADGCLQKDKRHIDFTSKDQQLACLYKSLIRPEVTIGVKSSGGSGTDKKYFRVQFSDVALYDFLLGIGLEPNKSLVLKPLAIPKELFADFTRGYFDGDGCITASIDKRWQNSYMFYTSFACASPPFLRWLIANLAEHVPGITGHIRKSSRAYTLTYAKADSRALFTFMYYAENVPRLERKYNRYLEIFARDPYPNRGNARVVKLVNTQP